jgi:hypothetical protein
MGHTDSLLAEIIGGDGCIRDVRRRRLSATWHQTSSGPKTTRPGSVTAAEAVRHLASRPATPEGDTGRGSTRTESLRRFIESRDEPVLSRA